MPRFVADVTAAEAWTFPDPSVALAAVVKLD